LSKVSGPVKGKEFSWSRRIKRLAASKLHFSMEVATYKVEFQVLPAASMKLNLFWDVGPYTHLKIERFRLAHNGGSKHLCLFLQDYAS
jgi:hypothetical protein